jgi:hypothetical protein
VQRQQQRFDAPGSIGQAETGPIESQKNDSGASIAPAHSFQQANVVPTGPPSAGETLAPPQPSSTATETPSPNNPVRMLGPQEIALLVEQGEQLVTAGDLATARSVLQRAAEAGDANAAAALAAIYDPSVLKKLGVVGKTPMSRKPEAGIKRPRG